MKDLPPKPQLGDALAKIQGGEVSPKPQPLEVNQKSHSVDLSPKVQSRETIQKQASEDANDVTHSLPETPVPLPRKINTVCRIFILVLQKGFAAALNICLGLRIVRLERTSRVF